MPVGRCVSRTALSTLLTFCPPAPPDRKMSVRISSGVIWTSTSSTSGRTATVAVERRELLAGQRLHLAVAAALVDQRARVGDPLLEGQPLARHGGHPLEAALLAGQLLQPPEVGDDIGLAHLLGQGVVARQHVREARG